LSESEGGPQPITLTLSKTNNAAANMSAALEKADAPNRYFASRHYTAMAKLDTLEGIEFRRMVGRGIVVGAVDEKEKEEGARVDSDDSLWDDDYDDYQMMTMTVFQPLT
jgi:hypothetical protein